MSTLQEYMLKNQNYVFNENFGYKKNNIFLNEDNIIKNTLKKHDPKVYLFKENEINLYHNDREVFKYFYGKDLTKQLTDFVKEKSIKTVHEYEFIPEVRLGKIQYLKEKINTQLFKPINKKKRILLENELKRLKKQENKAFKKLFKRQQAYLEASGLDNFIDSFSKFKDNLNFFKSNDPKDSLLKNSFKILLKIINFSFTMTTLATSVIGGGVVMMTVAAIVLGTVLLWMLARNADKVYDLIKKVLNNKIVKKILPFKIKSENDLQAEIEEIKKQIEDAQTEEEKTKLAENLEDINKEIEALKNGEDKGKAIALSIANTMKKLEQKAIDGIKSAFSKATKNIDMTNPSISNTIKMGLTSWKLWKIFKSPLTFFKEFFLGGLLDACKKVAKTIVDAYKAFKNKKLDPNSIEAKILEKSKKDTISDVASREASDVSSMVPEEIVYNNFKSSFDNYYLEHVKENILNQSLVFNYFEEKQSIPINDLNITGDVKGSIEVTKVLYQKDGYAFEIFPVTAKMKIYLGAKETLISDNEAIKKIIKAIGLSGQKIERSFYFFMPNEYKIFLDFLKKQEMVLNKENTVSTAPQENENKKPEEEQNKPISEKNKKIIEKINNTIIDNKNVGLVTYLKNLQKEIQTSSLEDAVKKVAVNSDNAKKIKTEIEKDLNSENEIQNQNYKNVITVEINNNQLLEKNTLYIPISENTDINNFKLQENLPNEANVIAYLQLRKTADEVKNNNYRFLGTLWAKKVFNYKSNKFISVFFEEEIKFQKISEKDALVSLKLENNKVTINSGKFLGMFGEKSKKGEIYKSFRDYMDGGLNKLKENYLNNLEKKYVIDDKQKVESKINDEIMKIVNLNFSSSLDDLINQKTKELDQIDFGLKNKTTEEQEENKEEEKKEENKKENLLSNSKLYLPILDNNLMKVNSFKLEKDLNEILKLGDSLAGYIQLEKDSTKTNRFSARIFAKKMFPYKKIDIVKAIFEAEENQTPVSQKNVFIDVTGEKPAILDVAYNQKTNDFSLSQKGGFLGIGKKIESRGELNNNFKQYVDNINNSIRSNINSDYKTKLKENEDLVNNILKDITNVNFSKNFRDIEEQKALEVEKAIDNPIEYETKKAEKEKTPIISSENAIALSLMTAISAAAIYVHTMDGDPVSVALKALANKTDVLGALEKQGLLDSLTDENLQKIGEVQTEKAGDLFNGTISNLTNSENVKELITVANQGKAALPLDIEKLDNLVETQSSASEISGIKDSMTDISQPADAITDDEFDKKLESITDEIPENHVTEDEIKLDLSKTYSMFAINIQDDENNIEEMEKNLELLKTKIETLENEIEEKNNLLKNAEENLTNAKEELKLVEEQFQNLDQDKIETLKSLSQKEIDLMDKQDETLGELTGVENDIKISEEKIGNLENSLGKLSNVNDLNKVDVEKEISDLQAQVDADPQNQDLKDSLEQKIEVKNQIDELEKTNQLLDAEKAKFNNLNQQMENIKNSISPEKMKEIETLKNEIAQLKEKTVDITGEEKENILKAIERIKNLKQEVTSLENDIEQTNAEIASSKENFAETEKEFNTAKENLDDAKEAEKELLEKEKEFSLDENSEYRKAFKGYLKQFVRQKLEQENSKIDFSNEDNKIKIDKMTEAYEKSMFDKNDPYWQKAPFLQKAMEDQNTTDEEKGRIFGTIAFREKSWLSDNIKSQAKAFIEGSNKPDKPSIKDDVPEEEPKEPKEPNKEEPKEPNKEEPKEPNKEEPKEPNKEEPKEPNKEEPKEPNKEEPKEPNKEEPKDKPIKPNLKVFTTDQIIDKVKSGDFSINEKKDLLKASEAIEIKNAQLADAARTGSLNEWQKEVVLKDKEKYMQSIKEILNKGGISTENLTESDIIRIASSAELTTMQKIKEGAEGLLSSDSYEYANKDEQFLMNEYFNFENKLKKFKR